MVPGRMRGLLTLTLVLVAGCSALPGLGVLTGQEDENEALRALEVVDLVMADKTGATDPSLIAAADRIEAATVGVDIIEIRKNLSEDALVVNMLFVPPDDANTQSSAGLVISTLRFSAPSSSPGAALWPRARAAAYCRSTSSRRRAFRRWTAGRASSAS